MTNKKKFNKAIISTTVAMLTVGTVLAGCGSDEKKPAAETSSAQPVPEKRGSLSVTIYDRGKVPAEEGTYADNRWTKWVNKNGPVDVKYVPIPRNESQQKLSTLFAAGEAPDLILEFDGAYRNQLWAQKQLMPLDDIINKYSKDYKALIEKYPALKKLGMKPDGKIYEVGTVMKTEVLGTMVIRKDWLDKLGLKVPTTMEELYNVADAFANKDPDGNGKKDTFGINLSQFASFYIDAMFQNEMLIVDKGELIRQFDRIKPAAEFKKKLFENGIVDKDFLTDKNGQKADQDFVNSKLGIYLGYKTVLNKNFDTLKKNNSNAVIIPMAFPKSQFGQFGPDFNPPISTIGVVNAKAKDPAAVAKYIDFMIKPSTVEYFEFGEDGVHTKLDASGIRQPIDRDKNTKEKDYNGDYKMIMSKYFLNTGAIDGRATTSTNPIDQEWIKIAQEMDKLYLDPTHPHPGFTQSKLRPALEKDLQTTFDNGWNYMNDMVSKTIVSGNSYTVDQAVKDIQDAWDKSGGKKLEEWYKNWYKENKDKWIFMDELYKMKF